MKLPEIWPNLILGDWVSRKAWKRNFAVQLCNLKEKPEHPVLMRDTQGYLFRFGQLQSNRVLRRTGKSTMHYGLQHDLLADDWYVCDQTACDLLLKEAEK